MYADRIRQLFLRQASGLPKGADVGADSALQFALHGRNGRRRCPKGLQTYE